MRMESESNMIPQRVLELFESNGERKSASAFVLYKHTVKEALEKQIAKKPILIDGGYTGGKIPCCPCCSTSEHYQPFGVRQSTVSSAVRK